MGMGTPCIQGESPKQGRPVVPRGELVPDESVVYCTCPCVETLQTNLISDVVLCGQGTQTMSWEYGSLIELS